MPLWRWHYLSLHIRSLLLKAHLLQWRHIVLLFIIVLLIPSYQKIYWPFSIDIKTADARGEPWQMFVFLHASLINNRLSCFASHMACVTFRPRLAISPNGYTSSSTRCEKRSEANYCTVHWSRVSGFIGYPLHNTNRFRNHTGSFSKWLHFSWDSI